MTPKLPDNAKPRVQVPLNIRVASYTELQNLCAKRGWTLAYAINIAIEEFLLRRTRPRMIRKTDRVPLGFHEADAKGDF